VTDLTEILAIAEMEHCYGSRTTAQQLRTLVAEHKALREALVAVCERGDTDHASKAMYWIACNALEAIGLNSLGKALGEAKGG
jgi:DNA-binding FadR family transcriptional regulator